MMKFILISSCFSLCCGSFDATEKPTSERASFKKANLDSEWVNQLLKQYPELYWLADDAVKKTEEGLSSTNGDNWSGPLFGKKYDEFERSLLSLICYQLILNGEMADYHQLTKVQPEHLKLSWEAFLTLHADLENLLSGHPSLNREEIHQAIQTALLLGDMGKTATAHDKAKPLGVDDPDHDDFIAHALRTCPSIFPSFQALPAASQKMLIKSTGLIHFGHVTHLEGGPEIFSKLKESGVLIDDSFIFKLALFVHTCDVAGALGHRNHQHSLTLDGNVYKALYAIEKTCHLLKDHDEVFAYRHYLKQRADWLGLDSTNSLHRVLTRVGAMLRLYTPEDGKILLESVDLPVFSPQTLAFIIDLLDGPVVDSVFATPTYIPAMLLNLINNPTMGDSPESRIQKAVQIGLPFIARVLDLHRKMVLDGNASGKIPLNFNSIAAVAKEKEAAELIQHSDIAIDEKGHVLLKCSLIT